MITSQERLDRMRKSFEKDRSVLMKDYKYFTTPKFSMSRASIHRSKAARKLAEQPVPKSPKRS